MGSLLKLIALIVLLGAALHAKSDGVYECIDATGLLTYSNSPCEAEVVPTVATLTAMSQPSGDLEKVDRDIAAVQSAIATQQMERKEALDKVYRRQGATQEEIDAQAQVVQQIYDRKLAVLEAQRAELGERRNALVEASTEAILQDRAP